MTSQPTKAELEHNSYTSYIGTEIATAKRRKLAAEHVATLALVATGVTTAISVLVVGEQVFGQNEPAQALDTIGSTIMFGFAPALAAAAIGTVAMVYRSGRKDKIEELNTHLTAITTLEVTPVTE